MVPYGQFIIVISILLSTDRRSEGLHFTSDQKAAVMRIFKTFYIYLPAGKLAVRIKHIEVRSRGSADSS
jgi:hypothetical protein